MKVGVDIEEVGRFRELNLEENSSFYEKSFTLQELEYCKRQSDPYPHLAARWCAKEAVIKCLEKPVEMSSIELVKKGKVPVISINGKEKVEVSISISHTRETAIAFAVVENGQKV